MYQEYPKYIITGKDEHGNDKGIVVFSKDEELQTPTEKQAEKPKLTRKKKEVK